MNAAFVKMTLMVAEPPVCEPDRERPAPAPIVNKAGVPLNQPRPTYNEATDGNRFAWILKAAKQVRIQEQAANETRRIQGNIRRRLEHVAQVVPGRAE